MGPQTQEVGGDGQEVGLLVKTPGASSFSSPSPHWGNTGTQDGIELMLTGQDSPCVELVTNLHLGLSISQAETFMMIYQCFLTWNIPSSLWLIWGLRQLGTRLGTGL